MQVTKNAVVLAIALAAAPAFSQTADARSRHYGHYGHYGHGHYGHGHYGHGGHFGYPGAFIGGFAAGAFLGALAQPYYGYGYAPGYYYAPPPAYYYPPPGYYYDQGYYGDYYHCGPGGVVSRPANAIC